MAEQVVLELGDSVNQPLCPAQGAVGEPPLRVTILHGQDCKLAMEIPGEPPTTVGQLKTQIQARLNILTANQRLFFAGQELSDEKILRVDIKLQDQSTLLLTERTQPPSNPAPQPAGAFDEERVEKAMRWGRALRLWAILQAFFSLIAAFWSPYPAYGFVTLFALIAYFGAKHYHFAASLMFITMSGVDMTIRIYQLNNESNINPFFPILSIVIDALWSLMAGRFLSLIHQLSQHDRDEINRRPPPANSCC